MKKLLLVVPLLLVGCDETAPKSQVATIAVTEFHYSNYLYTLNHDGHSFVVVLSGADPRSVVHHPGCQCLKGESQ